MVSNAWLLLLLFNIIINGNIRIFDMLFKTVLCAFYLKNLPNIPTLLCADSCSFSQIRAVCLWLSEE